MIPPEFLKSFPGDYMHRLLVILLFPIWEQRGGMSSGFMDHLSTGIGYREFLTVESGPFRTLGLLSSNPRNTDRDSGATNVLQPEAMRFLRAKFDVLMPLFFRHGFVVMKTDFGRF